MTNIPLNISYKMTRHQLETVILALLIQEKASVADLVPELWKDPEQSGNFYDVDYANLAYALFEKHVTGSTDGKPDDALIGQLKLVIHPYGKDDARRLSAMMLDTFLYDGTPPVCTERGQHYF